MFSKLTLLALVFVLIFLGPTCSILALNALFKARIQLTVDTWFAMMWLHLVLAGGVFYKAQK